MLLSTGTRWRLKSRSHSVEAPPDRLLELVTAYEAGAAKTDDMSTYIGMPEDEWDSVYENNVLPPMRALATEQPPATSAEGAIAAISHVMNDEDFFANRESAMNEMVLWGHAERSSELHRRRSGKGRHRPQRPIAATPSVCRIAAKASRWRPARENRKSLPTRRAFCHRLCHRTSKNRTGLTGTMATRDYENRQ